MFDRNLMKLNGMRAIMMALVVLGLLQSAAIVGQAFMLGDVVSALWSGAELASVAPGMFALFTCFAVLQLIRFARDAMLERFSLKQASSLRDSLLEGTFDPETMLAHVRGAAMVATSVTESIDDIQTYVRIIPPKVVDMVAVSLPVLVISYALDWVSGVILTVMFPVIIFFMVLLGRQAAARAERQYAAYTRLSNRFMDTLRGMSVITSFGAGEQEAASVHEHSERLRRATVQTLTTATLSSMVLDLCATFGVAAVAMMLAFRLMDGSMLLGPSLTLLILAPEYFAPIRSFASDYHASLDGRNALAGVLDMMGSDEGAQGGDERTRDGATAPPPLRTAAIRPWSEDSRLDLRGVSYRYGNGSGMGPVTLGAHGFERIAIVGPSGAGKSTLANVIAGFFSPGDGNISVDGVPAELNSDSWKHQVRYIPQHPYLFHASLLDNLRFYAPEASLNQVEEAVRKVGLDTLVAELPDGLHTVIGQGARGLSGGQAHRVALARVMLDERARILVFDEPTAHLDLQTELELKPHMLEAMQGKLVFFATHRLHWTHDLDRVIELEAGSVIGDHPGSGVRAHA